MFTIYRDFFTKEECNTILKEVEHYRDKWVFNPLTHMHILGNSFLYHTVLDNSPENFVHYRHGTDYVPLMNTLLQAKLSKLFKNVAYTSTFSKPGFHIIEPNHAEATQWHYDSDQPLMPYGLEFKDYQAPFVKYFDKIYTIILMLSDGEYSLDYYPETVSEYKDTKNEELGNNPVCAEHRNLVGDACPNPNCKLKEYKTVHYTQGSLLMVDSRILHRASAPKFKNPTDLRVIVRGYAVQKDDTLYLYW